MFVCVCVCFVWISEQIVIISLYHTNWSGFTSEMESFYCAVRTGSLNAADCFPSLQS